MIGIPVPNLVRHIYKVRRGKLTKIRIWQYADLSTGRTKDLFITDNYYNIIETEIAEIEIDRVIEEHSVELSEVEASEEELQDATAMLFDF